VTPRGAAAAVLLWLAAPAGALTLLSYNVENLFDDIHNGGEYREFDPARGGWTTDLFHVRIDSIAQVIRSAVPGGPDVIVLQEVENENTLSVLASRGLAGMGYTALFVPKKGVSANVALLSRLPVDRVKTFAVGPWGANAPMRDIVEADITVAGHVLYVLDNHWKSKIDGAKQTEVSRRESAGVLARRIAEILAADPRADIVAAGDFNESADEYALAKEKYRTALMPDTAVASGQGGEIFLSPNARSLGAANGRLELYEPWFELAPEKRGSYWYRGSWLTVDHILLSAGLFDAVGFTYRYGSFGPVRLAFLLGPKGTPLSAADPGTGHGYSDHLPLLITLDLQK
jgi:endonuclease/exonuclease/phosphatase family metal-dependent hydrolase